jgi:hypothetical protein
MDFITDNELSQNLFNLKINHSTLQVQNDSADCQYREGSHGCEVHSEGYNALGSPLPVPL